MKDTNYFINGLKTKNEKIILEIYQVVFKKVNLFVINNKGKQADAEDIFQKALLQILTRVQVQNVEIKSTFEGYLFTACKNLWRRELNKSKKEVTIDLFNEQDSEVNDIAQSILEQERWEFFQEKLEQISENCKEILKRFFNKITYREIAEEMGYNDESVVRQRVFKCKKKLIQIIKTDNRFHQLKTL